MTTANYDGFLKTLLDQLSPPPMSEEFRAKQEQVLKTPQGRALAAELEAYKASVLEGIVFSTSNGQQMLSKYRSGVEALYQATQAGAIADARIQEQEQRIQEQERRIQEQEQRIQAQDAVMEAQAKQFKEMQTKFDALERKGNKNGPA